MIKIRFKGFQKSSFIEYPGKAVSVVFTGGCNFRCPFCHNRDLVLSPHNIKDISEEEVINHIESMKNLIDGVAITGGEPTLHKELPKFIKRVKQKGFVVELETNGTNPVMVEALAKDRLVDYFAMDIKAPLKEDRYFAATGEFGKKEEILENIKKTIKIIQDSGIDYEFRTTFVPGLLEKDDIYTIAEQLKGSKKYAIQKFLPNSNINPEYEKREILSSGFFEEFREKLKDYFDEIVIRD